MRAAQALEQVWSGKSLDDALVLEGLAPRDQAQAQWLAFGTLRWGLRLEALLNLLLEKPFKAREQDLKALLIVALYELDASRVPEAVTVHEYVALTSQLGKDWARGLANAVLRRYLREKTALDAKVDAMEPAVAKAHPAWLVEMLQQAYPQHWPAILDANNAHPPFVLRVNARVISRDDYLARLNEAGIAARAHPASPAGIELDTPQAVESLPGWQAGLASVQDAAAQRAAILLDPQPGERVLDACAAPGGKTAHLLERADIALTAVDISPARLKRIRATLERLKLPTATLIAGDAAQPDDWWDGQLFDAILLDAPCSATGVIRRHPDIKYLRHAEDVAATAVLQQALLDALWALLRPGGRLLYATCSVLPAENAAQIEAFCQQHKDAHLASTPGSGQILPGTEGMDGFFYALLVREGQ